MDDADILNKVITRFSLGKDDPRVCNFATQLMSADHTEPFHSHEYIKIMRITAGKADWVINKDLHTLEAGQLVIMNSSESRMLKRIYPPGPLGLDWVQFTPMTVYPDLSCAGIFYRRPEGFTNVLDTRNPRYVVVSFYYDQLARNAMGRDLLRSEAVVSNLRSLLIEITRCYSETLSDDRLADEYSSMRNFSIMTDALLYIREHFAEDISERLLADRFYVSASYFSRLFRMYYGVGFRHYLRLLRLTRTFELLRASGEKRMNVLDAAFACGFTSASGFYKTLRELSGGTKRPASGTRGQPTP